LDMPGDSVLGLGVGYFTQDVNTQDFVTPRCGRRADSLENRGYGATSVFS